MSALLPKSEIPYLLECAHYAIAPRNKVVGEDIKCRVCDVPRAIVMPVTPPRAH
jgi:hypothetical protein